MYIRRKVFSRIEDENGEVRLFSTTDYELDCSEDRYFSEKEEERTTRLGDDLHIAINKNFKTKKMREAERDMYDEDPEVAKKGRRKFAKEMAKLTGGTMGTMSAIGGALSGSGVKGKLVGGLAGAAIGTGTGAAAGYVGSRVGSKIGRIRRNLHSTDDAKARRMQDQLKVANGDMSRKEFIKKYGKKSGAILN